MEAVSRKLSSQDWEGNFFLVKNFQEEASRVETDNPVDDDIIITPSKHNHKKELERRRQVMQTPTKSTTSPFQTFNLDDYDNMNPITPIMTLADLSLFDPSPSSAGLSDESDETYGEKAHGAEDEQTVNAAIVIFLKALTAHSPALSSEWTMHRKAFKANFQNSEYEARVDGYLRGTAQKDVRAIIEAKTSVRESNLSGIRIQESAQMVAWLKECPQPSPPYRRVHVSQGGKQIWLIFAEYDQKYLNYLHGNSKDDEPLSLLTMHEVGPYDTDNGAHMSSLAPILLALVLRSEQDRAEETKMSSSGLGSLG
ncbi:hypothetical protein AJ79_07738 [Helicocarpus griseus UAMH5409]|uniref:Uncharacterized protein n=1 Tax=Helicocarpus griseus UAMH5409 TaxID=1447875 RepID=A0A2B7WZY6_9EURO|nr:hypothetical protein AJ79_07738 [Helicocarpus griseus UAMH5409]